MRTGFIAVSAAVAIFCATSALAQTPAAAGEAAPVPVKPAWLSYKTPYTNNENPASIPNRSSEEITTWAQQTAAEVLSFGPQDYKQKLGTFKKYFVMQGWQLYAASLKSTELLNKVTETGYVLSAIVDSPPEIVQHGVTNGVYRWVVRLPVTVSLFHAQTDKKQGPDTTRKYMLFIDIAHAAPESGDNGVVIDSWRLDEVS